MAEKRRIKGPMLGAHMSIAGGLHNALLEGKRIGCDVVQMFVKSARQWNAPTLTPVAVQMFKEAKRVTDIHLTMAHASYLINLASPQEGLYEKSVESFIMEFDRATRLGITYLIVHPGSYTFQR